jgi:hypothetical protein
MKNSRNIMTDRRMRADEPVGVDALLMVPLEEVEAVESPFYVGS